MKRTGSIVILLFTYFNLAVSSFAQENDAAVDTVRALQEVVISGNALKSLPQRNFSVGTHSLKYTDKQLQTFRQQSLSDFVQANTAIYFKEYGKGMSSTMSMRGASASHTLVQWNGINLNMPTMGIMDFSHLPLFFFDAVEIRAGGESAIYGSGSIGGSVQLSSYAKYEAGVHAEIQQNIGSFGYLFSGASIRIANRNWESRTSMMYDKCDNDYWFTNITAYGRPRERLKNAAVRNYGILEEIYFRPSQNHELSARFWYADFKRQLQPIMSSALYDSIYDRNLRAIVSYKGRINHLSINAHGGYASDYELFREDVIAADKAIAVVSGEYSRQQLSVKIGADLEYIKPAVHAYSAGVEEWRADMFLNLRRSFKERWTVGAGIRQYFVTNVQVPLAPSAGISYQAVRNPAHNLTLRSAVSYNIKIPSLNDLYWGKDISLLRPEKGWNYEAGADYVWIKDERIINVNLTAYFNRISDWIRWLPVGAVWRPKNVGLLDCYGLEAASGTSFLLTKRLRVDMQGNYAYTVVLLQESNTKNDPNVGVQVAYQPKHCANFSVKMTHDAAYLQANSRYTGVRHTTDQFDMLPHYLLLDLSGGYTLKLYEINVSLLMQCNNVLNKDYQNIKLFAMPGRNVNFGLRIQF